MWFNFEKIFANNINSIISFIFCNPGFISNLIVKILTNKTTSFKVKLLVHKVIPLFNFQSIPIDLYYFIFH